MKHNSEATAAANQAKTLDRAHADALGRTIDHKQGTPTGPHNAAQKAQDAKKKKKAKKKPWAKVLHSAMEKARMSIGGYDG